MRKRKPLLLLLLLLLNDWKDLTVPGTAEGVGTGTLAVLGTGAGGDQVPTLVVPPPVPPAKTGAGRDGA